MTKVVGKIAGFLLVILIGIVNIGCGDKGEKINLSTIEIESDLHRFEQALFEPEKFDASSLEGVKSEFSEFYPVFNRQILRSLKNQEVESINAFRNYFDSLELYDQTQSEYKKFDSEFNQITNAQKRLKFHFPDYRATDITTMITGFNYKIMLLDSTVGVSLDYYLDDLDYTKLGDQVSQYQLHTLNSGYLSRDVMTTIVQDIYPDRDSFTTLLDRMVFGGKHLYMTEKTLPKVPDHILIGMTEEDYKWCKKNEQDIWRYFVSEELLYNNSIDRMKTYINEGPFSAGMPPEAPALTGNYIGWRLVQEYAKKHSKTGLREVIFDTDSQQILQGAKYNP